MRSDKVAVVADTGPLIALAGVGQLELLRGLFTRVLVPRAVMREVAAPPAGRPGAAIVAAASWLEVVDRVISADPLLTASLDEGEASVIALARTIPNAQVLLDERRGRRVAVAAYRLEVVGTVGVLVKAKRAGLLQLIGPSLEAIVTSGYFLGPKLVRAALDAVRE